MTVPAGAVKRRALAAVALLAWMGAVVLGTCAVGGVDGARVLAAQSPAGPAGRVAPVASATPLADLTSRFCVGCHNDRTRVAGLSLQQVDAGRPHLAPEVWEKVVVKLRSRAMPPQGARRPDHAAYEAVATWLEGELDRAAAVRPNPGRPSPLHRLNRVEYANAVRDLLGIDIDAPSMLPPDTQAHGFDTNADALTMDPALVERYLTAASRLARLAVGDPSVPPAVERYTALKGNANEQTWLWQTERMGEDFPLGSRGGVAARHYFPLDGEYTLRVRLARTYADVIRGLHEPNLIEVRVDGARVAQFTVGGPGVDADSQDADESLQARVLVKAGSRSVVATIVKASRVKAEGLGPDRIPIWARDSDVPSVPLFISSLLVGGPYNGTVSADSPSRQRVFVCRPASRVDERPCATRLLSALARRAYRRPPTAADVQTLVDFYEAARAESDFDGGVRAAIERLLVSPDFLFRIEADPQGVAPGSTYRLSDVELATRLSFFLWSSGPDEELLSLATRGRLREPAVLAQQARRLLGDPRARASLVGNFFGQWLQTRNVWLFTPDTNTKFPWFDDNLRVAMVRETELFLDDQLRQDRSVVDLLTADSTFLNEQLARHYDVSGVYGSHFRQVTLADENRWGLLGKASVLAVTSYPTRTSPTIRGKWLLENILATPVPPPPPDVNTNLDPGKAGAPQSVRAMLERHRTNPTCASCHAQMDPVGFSLENFDAIGQWRTTDAGAPVDAGGVLLDGTKVDGPAALRRALVAQKEQFVRAVAAKLLTYAVGREMEYFDAPAIRAIVRSAADSDHRWSALVLGIVQSPPFQMRRSRS
jgi:mono/diheme cytochrome c family protein